MTHPIVKRLVLVSVLGTSAAMLLMVAGVLFPSPFLLVLVMSVGQGLGLLALALFLLAVTLDLQYAVQASYDYVPELDETPPPAAGDDLAPPGPKAGT